MILCAFLVWYDEPVAQLRDAVRSTAGLCDRLYALDGAYVNFSGASNRSPKRQAEAILQAADEVGVEARVDVPDHLWAGQCQKRTALLQRIYDWGADWLIGIDADYVLHHDAEAVRAELRAAEASTGSFSVPLYTPIPEGWNAEDIARAAPGKWHINLAGKSVLHRLILRCLPEMRYEQLHWWLSGIWEGKRVALMGGNLFFERYPPMQSRQLQAHYIAEHRCFYRRAKNLEGNRRFCEERQTILALTGQEDLS